MQPQLERPDNSMYPKMTMEEVHQTYPDSFVLLVDLEEDPVTRWTVGGRVHSVAKSRKDLPRDGIRSRCQVIFTGKREVNQLPTLLWRIGGRR